VGMLGCLHLSLVLTEETLDLGPVGQSGQVDLSNCSCNLHREFTSFPHMRAAKFKEALAALLPHLIGSSSYQ
jgi:hypothetical protein